MRKRARMATFEERAVACEVRRAQANMLADIKPLCDFYGVVPRDDESVGDVVKRIVEAATISGKPPPARGSNDNECVRV